MESSRLRRRGQRRNFTTPERGTAPEERGDTPHAGERRAASRPPIESR